MKNIIHDVIDLDIFDVEGNLITQIKTMKKGTLKYRSGKHKSDYLIVTDALFNIDMLKQIGEEVKRDNLSDFERTLQDNDEHVIKFKKTSSMPEFKLIGRGIIYSAETSEISHDFTLVIPNAVLSDGYEMELEAGEVFTPNYTFRIDAEDDESFELRLKERSK